MTSGALNVYQFLDLEIRFDIKTLNFVQAIVNGDQLNDNSWHTVKYLRYGAFVLVQVDNRRSVKSKLFNYISVSQRVIF